MKSSLDCAKQFINITFKKADKTITGNYDVVAEAEAILADAALASA